MARPIKQGLDYFPLDVGFLQDIKIRRMIRGSGLNSVVILINLLSNIYRDCGYYLGWESDMPFLIADEIGVSEGAVHELIKLAVQVDFFDEVLFKEYNILTSKGIQVRYFEATKRRESIIAYEEYLLVDKKDYPNLNIEQVDEGVNVTENKNLQQKAEICNRSKENVYRNEQSKVKESKVKESKEHISASPEAELVESHFEKMWALYPYKKGKGQVSKKSKENAYKLQDEFERCIRRYISDVEFRRNNGFADLKYQNGSTFFNRGYIDYTDDNFEPTKSLNTEKVKKTVANFEQRDWDFDKIEAINIQKHKALAEKAKEVIG